MFEFTINPYNLLVIASVFIGTTFGLLLIFTKRINKQANRLLGFLSFVIVFWNIWVLSVDFNVFRYYPKFSLIPLNYSLLLGPLLFLYTKRLTDTSFELKGKQFWHFIPLLFELFVHIIISRESLIDGTNPVDTSAFALLVPIVQLLAIVSIVLYALQSLKLIREYHSWVNNNYSNDQNYNLRWLYRLLVLFVFFWLILVPYTAIDYFFFDFNLGISDYYPIYILMSTISIWISAEAFLRPELVFLERAKDLKEVTVDGNLEKEAEWLRTEMERNQFFLDPDMTLSKLAESLGIHPNKLSKSINSGLGKSFADFINEYRVQAVIERINDPKFSHITLLGISFGCGFNSKTTFNRVFKNFTGKTPNQYKKEGAKL